MLRQSLSDPTAGQTAQVKRLHPEVPQPILDPTDPRYGSSVGAIAPERVEEEDRDSLAERRLSERRL